jgi:hypothetical protein
VVGASVVGLGNVQRGSIILFATFHRLVLEAGYIQATMGIDPSEPVHIADQNFIGRQLRTKMNSVV